MKKPISKIDVFVAAGIVLLFLFFSSQKYSLFESLERFFYKSEMRLDLPTIALENKIAIVNIDAKSMQELGPWPWPRHIIGDMIRILKDNGARLIGLDLLLPEHAQNEGLNAVRGLYDLIYQLQRQDQGNASYDILLRRVAEIENELDEDRSLAGAIKKAGNIVLPVVGTFGKYDTELVFPIDAPLARNVINGSTLDKELKEYISVKNLISPFPELADSCRWMGHINAPPKKEKAGQIHLPFIDYRGNIIPSMPLVMALDYMKKDPRRVTIHKNNVTVGQKHIPTRNGEMFIKFRGARRSFPYYSFVDILKVGKVPAVFEGKIVLIGFTAGQNRTTIDTPVDSEMPQVELTANIINDLLKGRYLRRPNAMPFIEAFLLIFLAATVFLVFPRISYLGRTVFTVSALFFLFVNAIVLFVAADIWFKITYISLSIVSLYGFSMLRDFVVRERSMKQTSRESIETNRMLGLSFQSQGLLDLAFEKFRKCPLNDAMKEVLYNLGLDFERKRMVNKAISVYEYINEGEQHFRDLASRIPKLKKVAGELPTSRFKAKKEENILFSEELETKPTVGRYEIVDELGQGAMGMVYKARDPKINRLVAIKTIRFSDEFEEDKISEVKERFFKEAELAGKLSHPSIISIYDVGEDYELTYMAMELLKGKDLEHYCQKDTLLPLWDVLKIVSETAAALAYAHQQGVIHRDIKPANIMLLQNGAIKVTDFGIAKAVSSSQTRTGIILGTPNYMSPEQINGRKIDGRSDIFSLGVVFFQLLTGELPFKGKTLTELFYQITRAKHPSPKEINPKVIHPCVQLIDKTLAKDPVDRFQDAAEFARYASLLSRKIEQLRAKRQQP